MHIYKLQKGLKVALKHTEKVIWKNLKFTDWIKTDSTYLTIMKKYEFYLLNHQDQWNV